MFLDNFAIFTAWVNTSKTANSYLSSSSLVFHVSNCYFSQDPFTSWFQPHFSTMSFKTNPHSSEYPYQTERAVAGTWPWAQHHIITATAGRAASGDIWCTPWSPELDHNQGLKICLSFTTLLKDGNRQISVNHQPLPNCLVLAEPKLKVMLATGRANMGPVQLIPYHKSRV